MKKRLVAALVAMLSVVVVATPATAAQTQHVRVVGRTDGSQVVYVNGVESTTGTPVTGKRFNSPYICAQNNIGLTWNIQQADAAFESGVNTVIINYRYPGWGDQNCNVNYDGSQIMAYGTYNAADHACYTVDMTSLNGRYVKPVVIAMNVSSLYPGCRNTAQHRNNNISTATGGALGLALFSSCGNWTQSIMNGCYEDSYNFAGADDRNTLAGVVY